MRNLIRADIYAIVRGKALYITFAVILALNILVISTHNSGGGINIGFEFDAEQAANATIQQQGLDGIGSAMLLYTNMDIMVYFLLPLIILAAAPIFKHGTVKNDLAWGISRTKLYMSKLVLCISLCILMVVFYMTSGMLLATITNGWGSVTPDGYWLGLIQTLGAQLFMLIALACIGVFLVFTTKRTAAVNGAYIAFCFVPLMIMSLLFETGVVTSQRMMDFDITMGINRLGFLSQLQTSSILTIFAVGAGYMVLSTVGGLALFRKAEIK